MKKINIILLLTLSMLMMVACTKPPKPTQIKWIDDEDLLYVIDNPAVNQWKKKLGNPVAAEFQNDTTTYYYYYHPMMFNATDKARNTYKPTDDDRYINYWSDRSNQVAISVLGGNAIHIDYISTNPEVAKTLHPARKRVKPKLASEKKKAK